MTQGKKEKKGAIFVKPPSEDSLVDEPSKKKKTFCGFPWVETSTAGRVYDLCGVFFIWREHPKAHRKWFYVVFYGFLWRSRESNLRPLVYKA